MSKKYSWTVRIDVDETWVEDGFDITDERLQDMLQKILPYANSLEVGGEVLKAPTRERIRKAQGYKD